MTINSRVSEQMKLNFENKTNANIVYLLELFNLMGPIE